MAGKDFQRRWRLGLPGCNVVVKYWTCPTAPKVSGDGVCKVVCKRFWPFNVRFAVSIQIARTTNKNPHEGLEWVEGMLESAPRWTVEPDLEAVKRAVEAVFPLQEVSVTFLAQGAFNKVYDIRCGQREYVMRVSLPVDPKWKTLSEVATLKWIWREKLLPVPDIFAYETSRDNPVGFEWILMSKIPGRPLADVWRSMSLETKKKLVRKLAIFSSSLFKKQLRGIGNIYPVSKPKASISSVFKSKAHKDLPEVKRIVSMHFFWEDHILQESSRGPFRSSKDWLAARLSFTERDCLSTFARYEGKEYKGKDLDSDDEDNLDEAKRTLATVHILKDLLKSSFSEQDADGALESRQLRSCFLSCEQDAEPSMLVHDDLSRHNILVDEAGALTGVIDWECVSALPLWKACDYPSFLQWDWTPRNEEPDKAKYKRGDDDDEDDGQEGTMYWEAMVEYELTFLRRHFLDEMRVLEPGWIKVYEASQRQRDFDLAAGNCDNMLFRKRISLWAAGVKSGEENRSLHDRLYGL